MSYNFQYDKSKGLLYCFFSVNRFYQNISDSEKIKAQPNSFIAVRKIKSSSDFYEINQLDKYDKFIPFDSVVMKGVTYYPMPSTSEPFRPVVINDGILWIKMQRFVAKESNVTHYAVGRIEISGSAAKITAVDTLISLGQRFSVVNDGFKETVIAPLPNYYREDSCFSFSNDRIFFSTGEKKCFGYLYEAFELNGTICFVGAVDGKGAVLFTLDSEASQEILKYMPGYVLVRNKSLLTLTKNMIDEHYNYGKLVIEKVSIDRTKN